MADYELKLSDSSRALIDVLSAEIGNDSAKFKRMFDIAVLDKYPVSMRAARVVQVCSEKHPALVIPYLKNSILLLNKLKVDGVKRSFLKMILASPSMPDEDSLGLLTDFCFSAIQDSKQSISIRAYALDLLLKITTLHPELGHELISILESREMEESAGMRRKYKFVLEAFFKKGV